MPTIHAGSSRLHIRTFILLHDTGSSGADLVKSLAKTHAPFSFCDALPGTRFVFPDGPFKHNEHESFAWHQQSTDSSGYLAILELKTATRMLGRLVRSEAEQVGRQNVYIGGMGSGCTVGLAMLHGVRKPLGGFFGIDSWMSSTNDVERFVTLQRQHEPMRRHQFAGRVDISPEALSTAFKTLDIEDMENLQQMTHPRAAQDESRRLVLQPADYRRTLAAHGQPSSHVDVHHTEIRKAGDASEPLGDIDTPAILLQARKEHTSSNLDQVPRQAREQVARLQRLGFWASLAVLKERCHEDISDAMLRGLFEGVQEWTADGLDPRSDVLNFLRESPGGDDEAGGDRDEEWEKLDEPWEAVINPEEDDVQGAEEMDEEGSAETPEDCVNTESDDAGGEQSIRNVDSSNDDDEDDFEDESENEDEFYDCEEDPGEGTRSAGTSDDLDDDYDDELSGSTDSSEDWTCPEERHSDPNEMSDVKMGQLQSIGELREVGSSKHVARKEVDNQVGVGQI